MESPRTRLKRSPIPARELVLYAMYVLPDLPRAVATGTGAVGPLSTGPLSAVGSYVPKARERGYSCAKRPRLAPALMHVRSGTTPSQALRTGYNVIA